MLPYLIIIPVIFYLLISDFSSKARRLNTFVILCLFIYISCLGFFRFDVGVDYMSYYNHFESGFDRWRPESGFYYAVIILLLIGLPSHVVLGIFNLVTLLIFAKAVNQLRKLLQLDRWVYYIYILLPMFWLGSFNQVRQYLAVSITAYAMIFLFKSRSLLYISLVLIASLFHITALLFLPLVLLKLRLSYFSALIILSLIFIFNYFIDVREYLIVSSWYLEEGRGVSSLLSALFFVTLIILFSLKKRSDNMAVDKALNVFGLLLLGGLVLMLLGVLSGGAWANFDRLGVYFAIPVPLIIGYFLNRKVPNDMRITLKIVVVFICSAYYSLIIISGVHNIAPYDSYLLK